MKISFAAAFVFLLTIQVSAQFSRQDSLRGSITPERSWWDALHYDIYVNPDYQSEEISGTVELRFCVLEPSAVMQIDLQEPLNLESVKWNAFGDSSVWNPKPLNFTREGNVFYINFPLSLKKGSYQKILLTYNGKPREAQRPPWDGGWIWTKDDKKRRWMNVACQGLGASAWFPCKDHQYDEPDLGARLSIYVKDTIKAIANGNGKKMAKDDGFLWSWEVKNPINLYNIIPYIGHYTNWKETFRGENGDLECSYWVIDYNEQKARKQFEQVSMTLKAFEHWFGPFPFYEDGFKLVESPHLGMEHQSAIAYGNEFKMGYKGTDLSGTGWGLKWDFIIVHETGHEWFGNNISAKDVADMWIHEGFTNYSETLFTEYHFGKEAGNAYCIGTRKLIQNDKPIVGPYGVNQEGSWDMYYKGGNMIHTIRQIYNDDEKFRMMLREMNQKFRHQTVTTKEIENFISEKAGIDLSKVFDQYLRTAKIPVLEYSLGPNSVSYRWTNCVSNFDMKVKLKNGSWLDPTTNWKESPGRMDQFEVDQNFYIKVNKVKN